MVGPRGSTPFTAPEFAVFESKLPGLVAMLMLPVSPPAVSPGTYPGLLEGLNQVEMV